MLKVSKRRSLEENQGALVSRTCGTRKGLALAMVCALTRASSLFCPNIFFSKENLRTMIVLRIIFFHF